MAKNTKTNNIYINGTQAGQTLADLRKRARDLNREINQMVPGTNDYKKAVSQLGSVKKDLDSHRNEIKKVSGAYGQVKSSMGGIKSMVGGFLGAGVIMKAVSGITGAIGDWVSRNSQLEKGLSSLKSLTGASAEDIAFYKEEAIAMGKSTTQSANQVVDAMKLIGSAKPELLGNKEALADVTNEVITLAEAAEINMDSAAQAVTGSLNQFGKGAEYASDFVNVLAAGSQAGSANIQNLSDSMDKGGAVAAGFNVSFEESVGMLEVFAEKNLKGAEAGTAMRNVLLTMQGIEALPQKALDALEQYGVNTAIVKDETIPLSDRLRELQKVSGDATAMIEIFGRENIVAGQTILNNVDKLDSYTEAVTGTSTALEQQAINNDNLDGDLKSLESAWEGLALTIGAFTDGLRWLVQTGASVLNWITDTIVAFREWDTLAIEESALDWADALWQFGGAVQDSIDKAKQLNRLSQEVVASIEDETKQVEILTKALGENQKALQDSNTTEEESNRIKEENAEIVEQLKEQYPELSKEINFQTASFEELDVWQKKVTDNILKQAIEEVKAAEQKRILNDIVQETIALQQQQAKEAERWAVTNYIADIFADDAENMEENIKKLTGQLETLPETMKSVEERVSGLNINFSADFDANNKLIDQANEKLRQMENWLKLTGTAASESMKAQMEGLRKTISMSDEANQKLIDQAKNKQKAEEEIAAEEVAAAIAAEEEKEKAAQASSKAWQKRQEEQRKELEKANKELEKIIQFEVDLRKEAERQKELALKEGLDRELKALEFSIADKYEKEIAAAEELAQRTDEIGVQAKERLNTLLLLKEEEFQTEAASIKEEFRTKQQQEDLKAAQESAERINNIKRAQLNGELALAQLHFESIADHEVDRKAEAQQRILDIMRRQKELEFQIEKDGLTLQLESQLITQEEYNAYLQELEANHQMAMTSIKDEAAEVDRERMQNNVEMVLQSYQQIAGAFAQLQKQLSDNELAANKERLDEELSQLEKQREAGILSEEEFTNKSAEIRESVRKEEARIKTEQFKREKRASVIEAGILTALSILKASPNPAMMTIAGITGAAQLATIVAKPVPQFKKGGYNVKGKDDGKTYNANYLGSHPGGMLPSTPSLLLASEQGPEYFVPNPMLRNPEVIDHVRAIENIRLNQFAEGGSTAPLPNAGAANSTASGSNEMTTMMIQFLSENAALQRELLRILPNLQVKLGDQKIDDLRERMQELEERRA